VPAPEIVTPRLVLARLLRGDAASVFGYRSDPEVARYQSWVPRSEEETLRAIELQPPFGTPETWCQLGIRLLDRGQLIGDLGVHFQADQPHQVEIGFTVAPGHQRRGFGAEAVTGLLGHLFGPLHIHRVHASVDPRNAASVALLQRVGMRQEAHFRESLWFKGEWVDDLVFAVLESEWEGR
jgi:RimJ/RimL family protein N-acetyltransferase